MKPLLPARAVLRRPRLQPPEGHGGQAPRAARAAPGAFATDASRRCSRPPATRTTRTSCCCRRARPRRDPRPVTIGVARAASTRRSTRSSAATASEEAADLPHRVRLPDQAADQLGVALRKQAAYINQARVHRLPQPRVRTLAQFLLVDDGDPIGITFQSGPASLGGDPQARLRRLPRPDLRRAMAASGASSARLPLAPPSRPRSAPRQGSSAWKTVSTVRTRGQRNVVSVSVSVGEGRLRIKAGAPTSRAAHRPLSGSGVREVGFHFSSMASKPHPARRAAHQATSASGSDER